MHAFASRCPGCAASNAGRRQVRVYAEPEEKPAAEAAPKKRLSKPKGQRSKPTELPRTGFFGIADTKAPVYKPFAGMGSGDVTKRGGRWESDFIWNTKWEARMDAEADTAESQRRRARGESDEAPMEGKLSFARFDLDDMNTDLSEQLNRVKEVAPKSAKVVPKKRKRKSGYAAKPPSAVEARRWQRSAGYVARGASRGPAAEVYLDEEALEQAETDRIAFEAMKREYSLWTTGTVAAATLAVALLCPKDTAASYVAGALGGIAYLRLLNKSVDQFAAGAYSAGAAGGQQRLLIPVILVLVYNRYNVLYADQYGVTLELLPMLLGFFTYKAGVLGSGAGALYRELTGQSFKERNARGEEMTAEEGREIEATSMTRAFTRRILTK